MKLRNLPPKTFFQFIGEGVPPNIFYTNPDGQIARPTGIKGILDDKTGVSVAMALVSDAELIAILKGVNDVFPVDLKFLTHVETEGPGKAIGFVSPHPTK